MQFATYEHKGNKFFAKSAKGGVICVQNESLTYLYPSFGAENRNRFEFYFEVI